MEARVADTEYAGKMRETIEGNGGENGWQEEEGEGREREREGKRERGGKRERERERERERAGRGGGKRERGGKKERGRRDMNIKRSKQKTKVEKERIPECAREKKRGCDLMRKIKID